MKQIRHTKLRTGRQMLSRLLLLQLLMLPGRPGFGQDRETMLNDVTGYQRPPQPVTDILDVPPTPGVSLSPDRKYLLLLERTSYPPISDLAAPMLRLAGRRMNPQTNGPHMAPRTTGLLAQEIASGRQQRVTVPDGANIGSVTWSPNGSRIAFLITTESEIQLWVADVATGESRQVEGLAVNAAYGDPIQWMPDGRSLLVQSIVPDRGSPPVAPRTPPGPVIEQSSGQAGPVRTYQDLLQNAHDENLFEYYCTSQLVKVDADSDSIKPVGAPAIIAGVSASPDGRHLLITTNHRPFSYLLPSGRFPADVTVVDADGNPEFVVASLPLQDRIPIDGVPTGPRFVQWRATAPATLTWLEALDDGDPRNEVDFRDRVFSLSAPFADSPVELTRTEQRCMGITWGQSDGLAFVTDYDRDRRWVRRLRINADAPDQPSVVVSERSINDRYGDPGSPMMKPLPNGQRVMWQHERFLFLESRGATPEGDRPFLDRYDLDTGETTRLFQCDEDSYESVVALLADDGTRFITLHESPVSPPNFFIRSTSGERTAITEFPDPMPQLRDIRKELVTYERKDGVPLSFTLYLPPGYTEGERLPAIVWAYPREYNDPSTAGQVSGSTKRFTTISGISHLFLLTQGYAVLDAATMPVVGPPEEANNTFIEQIVESARAAIQKADELGVIDSKRVGVGGHSYGAFMTANLLAHSDLFRAGVARSGAYNRTLTPFGFQNERRTFWEAPEIYSAMSPFMAADRIREPILLIHGEADNNPGTFPIQSERLYQAIRGNGGTVRYVTLPHESHGYIARESVEHTLWEMITWFDQHVKGAP